MYTDHFVVSYLFIVAAIEKSLTHQTVVSICARSVKAMP